MKIHRLKTASTAWDAIKAGEKTAEFRRDDRGFEVGDILELVRLGHDSVEGEVQFKHVTHIVRGPDFEMPTGYAMLSFNDPPKVAFPLEKRLVIVAQQLESEGLTAYAEDVREAARVLDWNVVDVTDALVGRALGAKITGRNVPDLCVMDPDYPHKTGTNYLDNEQMRQLLFQALNPQPCGRCCWPEDCQNAGKCIKRED